MRSEIDFASTLLNFFYPLFLGAFWGCWEIIGTIWIWANANKPLISHQGKRNYDLGASYLKPIL